MKRRLLIMNGWKKRWMDKRFNKKIVLTNVRRPSESPYPISTTRWQLGVTGKHDRNNSSRLETNCLISSGSLFFNMWKTCKYGKWNKDRSYCLKHDIYVNTRSWGVRLPPFRNHNYIFCMLWIIKKINNKYSKQYE